MHGFRTTFRMWAAEMTNYPREVAEHSLAHQLPDAVERAYQRGSQFTKRTFVDGRLGCVLLPETELRPCESAATYKHWSETPGS